MFTGIRTVGIPWFEPEHWEGLHDIFQGADDLPILYDDWLDEAVRNDQLISSQGVRVFRVIINPDAFTAWCALKKLDVNTKSRKRYVAEGALRGGNPPVV